MVVGKVSAKSFRAYADLIKRDYMDEDLLDYAFSFIPERLLAIPTDTSDELEHFLRDLLHWFKHEFFTWFSFTPTCDKCQGATERMETETVPLPNAKRVEIYRCVGGANASQKPPSMLQQLFGCCQQQQQQQESQPACGALTVFPRYNGCAALLSSRTGRCGEWAKCFTLLCIALGLDARLCVDFTDHVWTEICVPGVADGTTNPQRPSSPRHTYLQKMHKATKGAGCGASPQHRVYHLDSCEAALDSPLMYEKGWGKKLNYVIAYSPYEVLDVTKRYTADWPGVLSRRTAIDEGELTTVLADIEQTMRESNASLVASREGDTVSLRSDIVSWLGGKRAEELAALAQPHESPTNASEQDAFGPRTSL
ncbi:unnamed protein product [Vitrella brassicaformis CCMP3155]|uniref:Transglutaminase-like domain-containing protein n=2 Tax=Vitrella brassicaformis TaxID=1169539 RepID=A0A0G4EFZ6_VITBC|nr:unnamed protein product [Vitrella brassicaformis CCMP3155]|eukprot:CEL94622.1 unnamed protein product [Vitrella brassicaformis CCMP3155]